MSLTAGQILDNKYRIVRIIGEGGMGAVYEGENTLIARRVAIKVLLAAGRENEQAMARFEREAQAAGRIGSDHILEVLDLGTLDNGSRYMVMEYLDGEPLSSRIERLGRMTPQQISVLVCQALKGLQAAHDAGIIHRDLKPDNIFVLKEKAGRADFVKIIDFGISKFSVLGSEMNMTRTGAVMGTPYYMSPEQAKGSSQVDPRSDVYAMGVIMYEALTGKVPFDGNTFNELMFKIVLSEPPPLQQVVPDIDPNFVAIVNRAMARELGDRYGSAQELMQALDAYLAGKPVPAVGAPVAAGVQPSAGTGADTNSTWANTNADAAVVPKRSLAPVLALVGVVVLAGGAFAAYKLFAGGPEAGATAASTPAEPSPSATPEPAKAEPPAESVKKEAPATELPADPEPTEPVEPPAPEAEKAKPTPAPAAKRAVASTARKPSAAKPAPAKPAAPAPAKPKVSPTDFGY